MGIQNVVPELEVGIMGRIPRTSMSPRSSPAPREKISVLLLDGHSVFARPVGLCLGQSPGLTLHVLSLDRSPPIRFSRHVRSFGVYSPGGLMEAIEKVCARTQVDVLFPVDEVATEFVTSHGPRLSCLAAPHPTPTRDNLRLGLDKWALAEYLHAATIPHPYTVLASSLQPRLSEFCPDGPVLLKPREGGNGRGIRQFADPAAAADFLAKSTLDPTTHLVQECIRGYDIDGSVLCRQGEILAFTIQRPVVMAKSFQPAGLIELLHDDRVLAVIRRLIAATQWSGVAHIDCRYDERDGTIKVIEINPRYWGSIYGSLCAGVNFPVLACQAALGGAFAVPDYAAVRYASAAATFKEWRRIRHAGSGRSHTAWRYFASDPLPEIAQAGLEVISGLTRASFHL